MTTFSYGRPSLNFYCDRNIPVLSGQLLVERWQDIPYVLAEAHQLPTLPPYREIARTEGMVLIQTVAQ